MYNDLLLDRLDLLDRKLEEDEERIDALIDEIEELDSLLSPEAQDIVRNLRPITVSDDVYEELDEEASLADRLADLIAEFAGSWGFITGFIVMMAFWMGLNIYLKAQAFDPYPFILLNLGLSTLAALQAPVILMSQNRQSDKDRAVAQNDYQVNLKSELEIADLHRKIDVLSSTIEMQNKLVSALVAARRQEVTATVQAIEARKQSGASGK